VHLDRSSDDLAAHLIDVHGFFPFSPGLALFLFGLWPKRNKKNTLCVLRALR
jgi:hypothetical protein